MSKFFYRFYNNPDIGNFNNRAAVVAWDSSSTTLPTGKAPVIDGVTIEPGYRVLFTGLTDPELNNKVHRFSIEDNIPIWTSQKDLQRFNCLATGSIIPSS